MSLRYLFLGGCLLGAGCAPSREAAFDDVRRTVAERSGLRVQWDQGTPEDRQAEAAVRELLSRPLTADAAVQVALLHNRELQALYEELGIARAQLVAGGLLEAPVFGVGVRAPTAGSPEAGTELELSVTQDFLSLILLPLRRRAAGAQLEAARLRISGEVLQRAWEVRTAFVRLQALEQLVELRRTTLAATGASAEMAARLRRAGNNTDLDLASEQVVATAARLDLAEAELALRIQREQLNALMGLFGDDTRWTVAGPLAEPAGDAAPLPEIEREAVESSLELAGLRAQLRAAAAQVGVRDVERWLPGLEVGIGAEREEGAWTLGPEVEVGLPLWGPGASRSELAQVQLRQVRQRYWARAVALRAAARALRERTQLAGQRVRYFHEQVLPLHERLVREALLQANAMHVGVFQLLEARRRQVDAQRRYVEALREYWLVQADLQLLREGRMAPGGMTVGGPAPTTSVPDPGLGVHD